MGLAINGANSSVYAYNKLHRFPCYIHFYKDKLLKKWVLYWNQLTGTNNPGCVLNYQNPTVLTQEPLPGIGGLLVFTNLHLPNFRKSDRRINIHSVASHLPPDTIYRSDHILGTAQEGVTEATFFNVPYSVVGWWSPEGPLLSDV